MKTKITLLAISTALLLTACGQVQSSPTETPLSPSPVVQDEVLAPGVHSQFGSGKNSQFKPER